MVRGNKKGPQAPHVSLSGPCHSRAFSTRESGWGIQCLSKLAGLPLPRERRKSNVERFPAAALIPDVGVIELEALVQALAGEVQLGAFEELKALRIDDDLYAVALEALVIRVDAVRVFDPVGKAGTARGAHAQAQAHALAALREEGIDVACGAFCKSDRHDSSGSLGFLFLRLLQPVLLAVIDDRRLDRVLGEDRAVDLHRRQRQL